MNDRVQTKLTESATYAGYLRDELRQAHAVGTAVESLLLLPMIQRVTELERDIQALMNAREVGEETRQEVQKCCRTCKHQYANAAAKPCLGCRQIYETITDNWEPKP